MLSSLADAGKLLLLFFLCQVSGLPFHDFMRREENVLVRVVAVLFWIGFVAIMEEGLKIGAVALGLKRNDDDELIIPDPISHRLTHYIAETPHALAICGFAVGMGFAFVENIPRYYAQALEPPLVTISAPSYFDQSEPEEIFLVSEGSLRASRVWTFFVWGLLSIQPWLAGNAAMKLSKFKAPVISPETWFSILKVVVIVHFLFDLLDRSTNAFVEAFGCLAIPYAIYTFIKLWKELEAPTGLLDAQDQ